MEKRKYHISGMFCAACVARVEKAIGKAEGVAMAEVNLLTNSAIVTFEGKSNDEVVIEAVEAAGYGCSLDVGETISQKRKARKKGILLQLYRVIAAFVLCVISMYFGMAEMMGAPSPWAYDVNQAIALGSAALCILLYLDYFYRGLKGLFTLKPDMLSLVSLGSLISFGYSLYVYISYLMGGGMGAHGEHYPHTYFDSAAMILFFVSLGKLLEAIAKSQSTSSLESLLALMPEKAILLNGDDQEEVEANALSVGDLVLVKPGAKIPADALIVEGYGNIEEAALTGESAPVYKSVGDKVLGGSMNLTGSFKAKVEAIGEDTNLSKVAKMVEEAAASKGKLSALADTISAWFVPAIILIAAIVLVVWFAVGADAETALTYAVATLVVACPCALGLATPVAVMVGAGRGSKEGILYKDAKAFETFAKAKYLVIDKTGTLTSGHLEIVKEVGFKKEDLDIVYGLESLSEHPLAWSIALYLEKKGCKKEPVKDFENIPGAGIKGHVGRKAVYVGNASLMKEAGIKDLPIEAKALEEEGLLVTYAAIGKKIAGYFAAEDTLKDGVKEAIERLQASGVEVVLASGDSAPRVKALAEALGIKRYYSEVKPKDKEEIVKLLKEEGRQGKKEAIVAMCGDGVNDAPALKAADVGIAIGTGTELATDSSDILLRDGSIESLLTAYSLSKKVRNNILMNLFWAFIYNIALIPIAAGAFSSLGVTLDPMWAALAMALSSLFVILNALRIKAVRLEGLSIKEDTQGHASS